MDAVQKARQAVKDAVREAVAYYGFGTGELHELRGFGRAEARRQGAAITNRELDRIVSEVIA